MGKLTIKGLRYGRVMHKQVMHNVLEECCNDVAQEFYSIWNGVTKIIYTFETN